MKKLFILLFCILPFELMAENQVIKIAILETIDKANAVEYGKRLFVRSTLAKTITATPGFEAYDRVDLSTIFKEQDFQRTGNVSSDQIKELGRMTGAQYIMVPEIAKMDSKTYYITAKILDVETAQAISMSDAITSTEVASMQTECSRMAKELLALPSQKQGQQTKQPQQRQTTMYSLNGTGEGHAAELGLTYDGKRYYQNGYPIGRIDVRRITKADMKANDTYAFNYYKKCGMPLDITGYSLIGGGMVMMLCVGLPLILYNIEEAGGPLMGIGGLMMVGAIPCFTYASKRRDRACDNYLLGTSAKKGYSNNMPNSANQPYVTMRLQYTGNGLGVAMNF